MSVSQESLRDWTIFSDEITPSVGRKNVTGKLDLEIQPSGDEPSEGMLQITNNYGNLEPTCLQPLLETSSGDNINTNKMPSMEKGDPVEPRSSVPTDEPMEVGHGQLARASEGLSEAFQVDSSTCGSDGIHSGLLSCKGMMISPLQEQLSNLIPVKDLNDSSISKIWAQNHSGNISRSRQDIDNLFAQNSAKIHGTSEYMYNQEIIAPEKMLHAEECVSIPNNDEKAKKNDAVFNDITIQKYKQSILAMGQAGKKVIGVNGEEKIHKSYAKLLAPPNIRQPSTGASPECGIVVERIDGFSMDAYAWAATNITGRDSISYIGRDPRDEAYVLIFMRMPHMADLLVNKGIWLRGRWCNVSYFQQPALKLTVSGVLPFIPDSLIIDACLPYGESVYPVLRKIPAAVRNVAFKGACSFRRELYLIRKKDVVLPKKLEVSLLGVAYSFVISAEGARCFACGSLQHTVTYCKAVVRDNKEKEKTDDLALLAENDKLTEIDLEKLVGPQGETDEDDRNLKDDSKRVRQVGIKKVTMCPPTHPETRNFFTQCNFGNLPVLRGKERLAAQKEKLEIVNSTGEKKGKFSQKTLAKRDRETSVSEEDEHNLATSLFGIKGVLIPQQNKDIIDMDLLDVKKVKKNEYIRELKCSDTSPVSNGSGNVGTTNIIKRFTATKIKDTSHVEDEGQINIPNERNLIVEEWCTKAKNLKAGPRKRLAAHFMNIYPDLVDIMEAALEVPKLYPPATPKFKKIQDFLEDIKQLKETPRDIRVPKRNKEKLANSFGV